MLGCVEQSPEFPFLDQESKYMMQKDYRYYADGFQWGGGHTGWIS